MHNRGDVKMGKTKAKVTESVSREALQKRDERGRCIPNSVLLTFWQWSDESTLSFLPNFKSHLTAFIQAAEGKVMWKAAEGRSVIKHSCSPSHVSSIRRELGGLSGMEGSDTSP